MFTGLKILSAILLFQVSGWHEQVQVRGPGYIGIQLSNGEMAYSRNLFIQRNADGVLVTEDGYLLSPNVQTIEGNIWRNIRFNGNVVSAHPESYKDVVEGVLPLYLFKNPAALKPIGAGLYQETSESGSPSMLPADGEKTGWFRVIN